MSKRDSMPDQSLFERGTMQIATSVIGVWFVIAMLFMTAAPSRAQLRASRALRSVEIERTATGWMLNLQFEFPVRYLSHSPQQPGRSLRIMVDPVKLESNRTIDGLIRENLPIPKNDKAIPLVQILYDATIRETPFVELDFDRNFAFEVQPASDFRGFKILVDVPGATTPEKSPGDEVSDDHGSQLLRRARHAVRDGHLDLAIALLTRVLELPDTESSNQTRMDAKELIGLTHERGGQTAHAQAEYEAFLEEYPDGPAAIRVRQRLDALLTSTAAPKLALRPSKAPRTRGDKSNINRELFGSMSLRYFRAESLLDDSDRDFLASNVLTDLDVAGLVESEGWALRGDFVGTFDVDTGDEGRSNDSRISRLSVQIEDRIHGLEATIGRQRRSDSGVLGRFDGVRLAADLGPRFTVSTLAGMPVESITDSGPDTDTLVAGGALDFRDVGLEGLEGQFFAVGRRTASMTDRAAIGSEVRYSSGRTYSFVYLDYDVVFNSLNTFLASSTYGLSVDTDFRVLIERRNNPVLTLSSALHGQNASDLDELRDLISESDIRDLALDRTAVSWTGTVGGTHRMNDRLQISGDLTVNYISDTDSSPAENGTLAVDGSDSFGPDVGGTIQLLVSDWLVENGVGSVSIRYFEGESVRSFLTSAYSRLKVLDGVRVLPRLRWEWRDSTLQGQQSVLLPSFEIEWRYKSLTFDSEAGIAWREPISGGNAFREVSYFLEVGARWEF
jgi:hypothetical protein